MPTPPPLPTSRLLLHAGLACALLVSALAAQPAVSPALEKFASARNLGLPALAFDLTRATVVAPAAATGPEKKAVTMLLEETESRTLVRWPLAATLPTAQPAIVVGRFAEVRALLGARAGEAALDETKVGPEGYQLATLGGAGSTATESYSAARAMRNERVSLLPYSRSDDGCASRAIARRCTMSPATSLSAARSIVAE